MLAHQGKGIAGQVGTDQMQHCRWILTGLTPRQSWRSSPKRQQKGNGGHTRSTTNRLKLIQAAVHSRMFELETLLAFGVGAGLVALAPMVRRMGHVSLGDSMGQVGRSMAKSGIKVGVTVAGVASTAARTIAKQAAEAAESLVDLVAEAKSEMETTPVEVTVTKTAAKKTSKTTVNSIPVQG